MRQQQSHSTQSRTAHPRPVREREAETLENDDLCYEGDVRETRIPKSTRRYDTGQPKPVEHYAITKRPSYDMQMYRDYTLGTCVPARRSRTEASPTGTKASTATGAASRQAPPPTTTHTQQRPGILPLHIPILRRLRQPPRIHSSRPHPSRSSFPGCIGSATWASRLP